MRTQDAGATWTDLALRWVVAWCEEMLAWCVDEEGVELLTAVALAARAASVPLPLEQAVANHLAALLVVAKFRADAERAYRAGTGYDDVRSVEIECRLQLAAALAEVAGCEPERPARGAAAAAQLRGGGR